MEEYYIFNGRDYIELYKSSEMQKIKFDWYDVYCILTKPGFFSSKGQPVLLINILNGKALIERRLKNDIYWRERKFFKPDIYHKVEGEEFINENV